MMKLFYSNTSPYSRKVRIALLEKGLDSQVEYVLCNPFDAATELKSHNPLGKIPTLVLDDGCAVYDSPVICEYLDVIGPNIKIVPAGSNARLLVQMWQALADGIIDASYNIVMEGRRSKAEQSENWRDRWQQSIKNSLDHVEQQIKTLPNDITIAQISLGAALGYLDFRLPYVDWRNAHPETAVWFDRFAQRASMVKTAPPE